MAVTFWLTDEDSDIASYKRARLGARSDCCSLLRSVTNTAAGPSSGIQITRAAGGTALAWITDPLSGVDLTAAAWEFHIWAKESNALANAALRFQVFKYTTAGEAGTAALDDNNGTELSTTVQDYARTSGNATITALADGDRLVFKILVDDAGTMATGYTVTVSLNGQYPKAEGDSYIICPDTLVDTAAMPAATRTQVRRHLKDTSTTNPLLTDGEVDEQFVSALAQYNRDRPRRVADLMSGDGSAFLFVLPRSWIWGFSRVVEIEYPYDTTQQTPTILEPRDFTIEQATLGLQPVRRLRFTVHVPANSTDNILVRYTTRHVHNDELDTVPAEDFEALTFLAAAYCAETLAAKMAATSAPTITADSADYAGGQEKWSKISEQFRKLYEDHITGRDRPAPVTLTAEWDTQFSTGVDFMWHRRRMR